MAVEESPDEDLNPLRLGIGEVMQIQFVGESERYHARLVGFLEERSIIVTIPVKNKRIVPVRAGQSLNVRMMVSGRASAFTTTVIQTSRVPYLHMHLEYPKDLVTSNIRKAVRVEIRVDGTVINTSIGERGKEIDCFVADISETGAHLVTPIRIGKSGDEIDLVLPVEISNIQRTLEISGILRSRIKTKSTGEEREVHYGVEFKPGSDDQRISMIAFIYSNLSHMA